MKYAAPSKAAKRSTAKSSSKKGAAKRAPAKQAAVGHGAADKKPATQRDPFARFMLKTSGALGKDFKFDWD
jgi:hypothetical protein